MQVKTSHGKWINFEAACALMDDDIVARLGDGHMSGLLPQSAYDAYVAEHRDRFGCTFEPDRICAIW